MNTETKLQSVLKQFSLLLDRHRSIYSEVLRVGIYSDIQAPQTKLSLRKYKKKGECFRNASILALEELGYTYCEGFAFSGVVNIPIHHAWLLDEQCRVLDPTWGEIWGKPREYFGVAVPADKLREEILESSHYGLFDGHRRGMELIRQGIPNDLFLPAEAFKIAVNERA